MSLFYDDDGGTFDTNAFERDAKCETRDFYTIYSVNNIIVKHDVYV